MGRVWLLALVLGLFSTCLAQETGTFVSEVAPSVVQIQAAFDQMPEDSSRVLPFSMRRQPMGSGFVVGEGGYVVTALHVIEAYEALNDVVVEGRRYPLGPKRLLVGFAMHADVDRLQLRGSFEDVQVHVVDRDQRHDLALLKFDRGVLARGLPLNVQRPTDGEAIALSGFPLGKSVMVTTKGIIGSAWDSNVKEVPKPRAPAGTTVPDLADVYLTDIHANPGNSGGPVYSVDKGEVIGVCVAFDVAPVEYETPSHDLLPGAGFYNSGLAEVVPAKYVANLLQKNGVRFRASSASAGSLNPEPLRR